MTTAGHLTDDPELLESYARGRLAAEALQAWEAHLDDCAPCREAVRQERTLQAGIMLAGREEARRRLRRGIVQGEEALRPVSAPLRQAQGPSGPSQGKVPWPRVWSIAAAVLILAGLGVVGRWLTLRPSQEEAVRNEQILSEKAKPAPAETLTQERGTARVTGEQKAAPSTARSERNAIDQAERRRLDVGEQKTAAEAGKVNDAPGAADRTEGVRRGTDEGTLTGGAGQLSWGQESERQATAHLLPGGPEGSAITWGAASRAKDATTAPAASPGGASRAAGKAASRAEPISVTFREGADQEQPEAEGGGLPALVRRDSSGVHITILLPHRDSMLSAGPAHAVRVAADSVVIVTARRRLGLRLPAR